jgi:hypothetical protein
MSMDSAVELADLIGQLRHELSRAMWAGENADLRFEAETVELELTVAVEKARQPGARVRFWVLDAGVDVRRVSTATQKITLVMRPIRADVPHRPATIVGTEVPGED